MRLSPLAARIVSSLCYLLAAAFGWLATASENVRDVLERTADHHAAVPCYELRMGGETCYVEASEPEIYERELRQAVEQQFCPTRVRLVKVPSARLAFIRPGVAVLR